MTNVFIIHGTGGHPGENWFPWLKNELEKLGCKVFVPQFPTPQNQTPEAWFRSFGQYREYFTPDTILIGHSLGGTFALRILEAAKIRIKAAFIVAAPIGILPIKNYEADKPFIGKPFDWEKIRKNCARFFVFHSEDDPLVSVGNGRELAKRLGAELVLFKDAGHFNAKADYVQFEELLERIKTKLI
ncbi:MAG: alpha/beta fold hydrolase [Candidatus Burarchaeum sp.]|nr:alpha/beta fold hydrolase [Candidatus Burarchaeum sp.]MDO8339031.1 alpha/beta fold hydrolase [Candidatus Burarchaeum sp.]